MSSLGASARLDQEDAVARDGADGGKIGAARQDVEGVEHQADRGMVGAAHRLPGVAVVVDVPAPGQRLEGDPHAAAGGAVTQLAQVGGGAVDAAQAVGRDVGADHQEIAVQLLHDVELALGAGRSARSRKAGGMPSKSRNGWKVMVRSR